MTNDDGPIPLEACTLPGTITVTGGALALAERFHAAVPFGWIVAFSWHDNERVRASKDAPWEEKGPGIGLGAYQIGQIPEEALYNAGALSYAVLISKEVVENHPERTIDLDESGKVVFR